MLIRITQKQKKHIDEIARTERNTEEYKKALESDIQRRERVNAFLRGENDNYKFTNKEKNIMMKFDALEWEISKKIDKYIDQLKNDYYLKVKAKADKAKDSTKIIKNEINNQINLLAEILIKEANYYGHNSLNTTQGYYVQDGYNYKIDFNYFYDSAKTECALFLAYYPTIEEHDNLEKYIASKILELGITADSKDIIDTHANKALQNFRYIYQMTSPLAESLLSNPKKHELKGNKYIDTYTVKDRHKKFTTTMLISYSYENQLITFNYFDIQVLSAIISIQRYFQMYLKQNDARLKIYLRDIWSILHNYDFYDISKTFRKNNKMEIYRSIGKLHCCNISIDISEELKAGYYKKRKLESYNVTRPFFSGQIHLYDYIIIQNEPIIWKYCAERRAITQVPYKTLANVTAPRIKQSDSQEKTHYNTEVMQSFKTYLSAEINKMQKLTKKKNESKTRRIKDISLRGIYKHTHQLTPQQRALEKHFHSSKEMNQYIANRGLKDRQKIIAILEEYVGAGIIAGYDVVTVSGKVKKAKSRESISAFRIYLDSDL